MWHDIISGISLPTSDLPSPKSAYSGFDALSLMKNYVVILEDKHIIAKKETPYTKYENSK